MTFSIHTTQEHINALNTHELTPKKVADRLVDVIAKAEGIYREKSVRNENTVGLSLEAILDDNIEVNRPHPSFGELSLQTTVKCSFCIWQNFKNPFEYTITNLSTQKSIQVSNVQFHLIQHHHYFQPKGWSQVDPIALAEVLGLSSASQQCEN